MKIFHFYSKIIAFALCIVMMSSCSDQVGIAEEEKLVGSHLPEAILDKVMELGGDPADYQYSEIAQIDGSTLKYVSEIGVDAGIMASEFLKLSTKKQYRTQFLVNTSVYKQIDIYGFTGQAPFGLSAQSRKALTDAVNNWNRVKSNAIHLNLVFNSSMNVDFGIFETLVTAQQDLGSSGLALFPTSDGRPGQFVNVDSEMVNLGNWSADALEHIFTHELGHTIGFRHTDWQTRRSCVEAGLTNAEEAEPFAQLLPWTLPNFPGFLYQTNSIMNACFNINTTNGELNSNDKRGLQNMYFSPYNYYPFGG